MLRKLPFDDKIRLSVFFGDVPNHLQKEQSTPHHQRSGVGRRDGRYRGERLNHQVLTSLTR